MDKYEVAAELTKASPPIGVSGLMVCGVALPDIVLISTFLFTVLQVYFLLRDKWWRQRGKS